MKKNLLITKFYALFKLWIQLEIRITLILRNRALIYFFIFLLLLVMLSLYSFFHWYLSHTSLLSNNLVFISISMCSEYQITKSRFRKYRMNQFSEWILFLSQSMIFNMCLTLEKSVREETFKRTVNIKFMSNT
jgi:hypothetical protein